jgi:hypothetical protein
MWPSATIGLPVERAAATAEIRIVADPDDASSEAAYLPSVRTGIVIALPGGIHAPGVDQP